MSKLRKRAKSAIVRAASWLPFFFGMMSVLGSGVAAQTVGLPSLVDTTNAANISSGTLPAARMCGGTPVANYFCDRSTGLWTPIPWTVNGTNSALAQYNTFAPAASQSAMLFTGALLTGGTSTTNLPHLYFNQAGTTPAVWGTGGTALGVNVATAFTGQYFNFVRNGVSVAYMAYDGNFQAVKGAVTQAWGAGFFYGGIETVTPSATPTFSFSIQISTLTLNTNVTSSTLGAGQINGEFKQFHLCQPATGGPFTFTWPTNVLGGGTIGTTAGKCSDQSFWYSTSGSAWYATAPMSTNM